MGIKRPRPPEHWEHGGRVNPKRVTEVTPTTRNLMTYADGYYLSDDEEQAKRDAEWAYQVESEMIWEEQSVIRWQLVADLTGSVCIHCGKPCVYLDSRVTTDQTRKLGDVLVHRACADDYVFTTVARIHREAQAERGRRALGVAA